MRRARGPLAAMVLTIVGACHGVPADDRQEIAALRLTCVPIPQGIRCLLLALSRHVARAPRDDRRCRVAVRWTDGGHHVECRYGASHADR